MYLYQSTLDIFGGTITGGKVTGKGGGGAIANAEVEGVSLETLVQMACA